MKLVLLSVAASLTALALVGCETPSDQAIESARACTDTASKMALSTNTTDQANALSLAQTCEQIITSANANSPEAMKIKFGDILIEDKILANIAQVAAKQKNSGGSLDSIDSMVSLLVPVPLSGTKDSEATRLVDAANGTGSAGMVYVASLIQMAVSLDDLASLNPSNPAQAQTDLNNCKTDPTCYNQVATTFDSMATAACASPYDQTSTDPSNMCYKAKQIEAAAGTDPTAQELVTALAAYASTNTH